MVKLVGAVCVLAVIAALVGIYTGSLTVEVDDDARAKVVDTAVKNIDLLKDKVEDFGNE